MTRQDKQSDDKTTQTEGRRCSFDVAGGRARRWSFDVLHKKKRKDKDKTRQDKTRQDKTRQDKTRQDKTRPGKTRQEKITPPSDTEETKTNTRKKARMEGTYLKIGGKNIQFKKALASGILKKVQRKCPILFFIPNVVFLEFIMTHLLSLYI
jgi:hypothetical protein